MIAGMRTGVIRTVMAGYIAEEVMEDIIIRMTEMGVFITRSNGKYESCKGDGTYGKS